MKKKNSHIEPFYGNGAKIVAENCTVVKLPNGEYIVEGYPKEEDTTSDSVTEHDCDYMECPSWGPHIILTAKKKINY